MKTFTRAGLAALSALALTTASGCTPTKRRKTRRRATCRPRAKPTSLAG